MKTVEALRNFFTTKVLHKSPEIITKTPVEKPADSPVEKLYLLAMKEGVQRFSFTKGLSLDKNNKIITHKDAVVVSEDGKLYVISAMKDENRQTVQIADYKVKEGIQRTLLFINNIPDSSLKTEKEGILTHYFSDGLSLEEQTSLMDEVSVVKVDTQATKELGKKDLTA
jgi:hypothetical protein